MSNPLDPAAKQLRDALRQDAPKASFRGELRDAFASGALGQQATDADVLAEAVTSPQASPAFRAGLRAEFVSGALGEAEPAPVLQHPSSQRLALLARVVPLVAAAALALFFLPGLLQKLEPVPQWRILSGEQARFEGGRLAADSGPVRLALGDGAFLEVQSEGRVQLEPPCWLDGDCLDVPVRVDGFSEAILFAGDPEHSVAMKVETASAQIELSGAVASVLPCDGGTCIVIGNGAARVRSQRTGEVVDLAAGDRVFVTDAGQIQVSEGFVRMLDRPDVQARILNLQAAQADMAADVF